MYLEVAPTSININIAAIKTKKEIHRLELYSCMQQDSLLSADSTGFSQRPLYSIYILNKQRERRRRKSWLGEINSIVCRRYEASSMQQHIKIYL